MNRLTPIPLVLSFVACSSAPIPARPTTPATPSTPPDAPAIASDPDAPRPVTAFAPADLVPQAVHWHFLTPNLAPLRDGRYVATGSDEVVITDASLRATRVFPIPVGHHWHEQRPFVDPEGRFLKTSSFGLDLATGEFVIRPPDSTELLDCDRAVSRCLRVRHGAEVGLLVEEVPLRRAIASLRLDAESLGPNARPTRGAPFLPRSGAIEGDRAVLTFDEPSARVCSVDLRAQTISACLQTPTYVGFVGFGADGRVFVGTERSFGWYEPTTLAEHGETHGVRELRELSSDGELALLGTRSGLQVVETRSGAALVDLPSGVRVQLGTGLRFVVHEGNDSILYEGSTASAPMRFADEAEELPSDAFFDRGVVWEDEGALIVAPPLGVARLVPGATEVRFGGLHRFPEPPWIAEDPDTMLSGSIGLGLRIDAEGIHVIPRAPDEVSEEPGPGILRADAPASTTGPARAELQGGTVRFLDRSGAPAGRTVRLPRPVAASGCGLFEFLSDFEVALHGSAPCIPTRIDARTGNTTPLGPAYVRIARTPDRRRSLMLADRRIQLLDGITGDPIVTFAPGVDHGRIVAISADGTHGVLTGTDGFGVFDFRDVHDGADATAVRIARFTGPSPQRYSFEADRVFGCTNGVLEIAPPFAASSILRIEGGACSGDPESAGHMTSVGFVDGVFMAAESDRVSLVRLADGAALVLRIGESGGELSFAVLDGTRILGIHPDDSDAFAVRDPASGLLVPVAPSGDAALAAIRAFFAGP